MSGSITLHPKLGVNARLTICPRCGGEGKDLVMMGNRNYKDICDSCGCVHYGGAGDRTGRKVCQKCGGYGFTRQEMKDGEKVPGSDICNKCKAEIATMKMQMESNPGSVAFRCAKCRSEGIIKGDAELAKLTRKKFAELAVKQGQPDTYTVQPFTPCGIELEKCPNCDKSDNKDAGATSPQASGS